MFKTCRQFNGYFNCIFDIATMNNVDVIIIGAGASGLMAARSLSKGGYSVAVLEARNRCGGRIHTLNQQRFFKNAELGAEFIHGDLPVTFNLLHEAGIAYHAAGGEMLNYKNGKFSREGEFSDWDLVVERLGQLKTDVSIAEFLNKEFPGDEHGALRASVIRFVSGYDTADPETASSFALREEWQNEDEGAQHRVTGGYGAMIQYMEGECKAAGAIISLNSIVREIQWQAGQVAVTTTDDDVYHAGKAILALPLGVLKADGKEYGAISFSPEITKHQDAIKMMGFGAIIKVLLEFDAPFWDEEEIANVAGVDLKNMSFVLSDQEVPTWWTQVPERSPVLTGWLGGLPAARKVDAPTDELLQQSLQSLGNIFKKNVEELKDRLVAFEVMNWTADPFTRGSYAYDTVGAHTLRKILSSPVENTLFFAGEYLYEGPAMGTVEAALTSGRDVAGKIMRGNLA